MEILWFKIISLLVIFAAGLFGGLAPTKISLTPQGKRKLTLGNAFSGGVFLGAGLLHMLPDARENFTAFAGDVAYPYVALICGGGFLLVMLLEKAVLGGSEDIGAMSKGRSVYPYLLCVILSVHSIIVGTSLGLEASLVASVGILVAILAHKWAAAFALGVSLRENGFSLSLHVRLICFFALMAPLGVVLGTIFSALFSGKAALLFEAVFDALAAGTFLYVACADVMEEVFRKSGDNWRKVILIICGFFLMALIAIWT
ncbi:putative divalent heavy-metal cations transporter [Desulfocapsa sulfexigens DSM 10523]|uniref:Putative divalent heavy-metal cations transporter n=1 Tax=Desulfocapsa sulfexigens (strain DSM 10523 / SB164P1) TaxID=1167006 RepID=M1PN81_DESSD|nr:ZIP family metal transporter [Desulfocapsa sulfexigens]AGF77896.1 putative divalent heavy-metal cations transporter [Desulfocapsa sulfexigens DSM 10523]